MKKLSLNLLKKLTIFLLLTALTLVSVCVNAQQITAKSNTPPKTQLNKKFKEKIEKKFKEKVKAQPKEKDLPFVSVIKSQSGFQLEGDSCETLYKEIFQFDKLFIKYDRPDAYIKPLCIESIRSVHIESLIPKRMLTLLNQKPQYFGPNCWNSVLFVNQMTDHLRFVQPDEFQRSLPFLGCYKKDVKELEAGDIVRINDKLSEEQHAFIFISENLSFTKNGPGTKAAYEIVSTGSILKEYDVDIKCLLPEYNKAEKCLSQVTVYNCDMKVVEFHKNKFSEDTLNNKLTDIEKKLEFVILNYRDPQLNEYKYFLLRELLQNSKTLKFIVDKELNETNFLTYKFFLYKHYQTRLLSISEQISYF